MLKLLLFADTTLPKVDIWFFAICAAIIAAIIGIYYLIPVLNKKQYREQRENLKKREVAFKANQQTAEQVAESTATVACEEQAVEEVVEPAEEVEE